jgi:8-oxo-dGTP pyrophosphatase MutT (NUDIX family)
MIQEKIQLFTAGLLLIKNRKLLLAYSKNKKCFYLPGGKIDNGETAIKALCREIEEELNIRLAESDLTYYIHISAPAFGEKEGVMMEQDCFFAATNTEPVANAEIGELKYFSSEEYTLEHHKAPGALMVLEQLKADNLID